MSDSGVTRLKASNAPAQAGVEQADTKPAYIPPTLLKSIAGFVGWLTTSLAGVGAILYGLGYLIMTAQLHLLGINGLVTYSHERYLQEGGNFFIAVGPEIITIVLAFIATFIVVSILPGAAFYAAHHWFAAWCAQRIASLTRLGGGILGHWRIAAYIAALLILFFVCLDPQTFSEPLTLSNLLFTQSNPAGTTPTAARLQELLVSGDKARLAAVFSSYLYFHLLVVCLLAIGWHLVAGWRFRKLAISPFAVVFLLYTIFLPMLYGVLKRPIQFPIVTLKTNEEMKVGNMDHLFLLSKGEQEIVLFEPTRHHVLWLPVGQVRSLDIEGSGPILKPSNLDKR